MPDHHEVGGESLAAVEVDAARRRSRPASAEVEDDAVLLVQRADEFAELGPKHPLERTRLRRHHVHFQLRARAARRRPRGR